MPYIIKEDRKRFDNLVAELSLLIDKNNRNTAGQLNYIITTLLLKTYTEFLPSYQAFNEIIGVLECAKLEMYRRPVGNYEDRKIEENGDV